MKTLEITEIQHGCTHDGPGLRTVVFLKGCPLHCKWCHNPETQRRQKEVFYSPEKCIGCMACVAACRAGAQGQEDGVHIYEPSKCIGCVKCAEACPTGALESVSRGMTVEEIMEQVRKDKVFYRSRGGLTVSGGEPTFQPDVLELLQAAKSEGIGTCMETCGVFSKAMIPQLLSCTDLFLYDIKDTDSDRLLENTGANLQQIVENLLEIDAAGSETVLRCVLIPEVNLCEEHAEKIAEIYGKLRHCRHVELLTYHPYGLSKTERLGQEGVRYRQPETEELTKFAGILREKKVPIKLHGSILT